MTWTDISLKQEKPALADSADVWGPQLWDQDRKLICFTSLAQPRPVPCRPNCDNKANYRTSDPTVRQREWDTVSLVSLWFTLLIESSVSASSGSYWLIWLLTRANIQSSWVWLRLSSKLAIHTDDTPGQGPAHISYYVIRFHGPWMISSASVHILIEC